MTRRPRLAALLTSIIAFAVVLTTAPAPAADLVRSAATTAPLPRVRHVFVVNLENKGFASTFGPASPAPYLSRTLRSRGVLLSAYYGTAHHSLPNYIAEISGQAPNPATQRDCPVYTRFVRTGTAAPGQAVGRGCVYPAGVPTVGNQLSRKGFTWRAYMQDMGRGCRHPALGTRDATQRPRPDDEYATRHNPFAYFRAVTGRASCSRLDVDLGLLRRDLRSVRTTRNLSFISPDVCDDGHDSPCADGRAGGLPTADGWLRRWVPVILGSPAFRRDGLLVVTFDEAEAGDASACCGERSGPNTALAGITGPGGGRVGAVLVSRFIAPGRTSTTPYDHYSLLRTVEDLFGLGHLGYAGRARPFGTDVFSAAG